MRANGELVPSARGQGPYGTIGETNLSSAYEFFGFAGLSAVERQFNFDNKTSG
jgi:hypothetical protein